MGKLLVVLTATAVVFFTGEGWGHSRYSAGNIPAVKNTVKPTRSSHSPPSFSYSADSDLGRKFSYTFLSKGLPFGTVLEMLQKAYGFEYYVEGTGGGASIPAGPAVSEGVAPASPSPEVELSSSYLGEPVYGYFKDSSLSGLIGKICRSVDYYCVREGDIWKISRYQYFETDLPFKALTSVVASNGQDGFSVGKDTYDSVMVSQIKSLLSSEGKLVRSPAGYLAVIDRPSRVRLIRRVLETEREHEKPIKLSVRVLSFTARKNLEHGIDWSAILTRLGRAYQLKFSSTQNMGDSSTAFSFKFNSKSYEAFIKALSELGDIKIVKSSTITVMAGTPQSTTSVLEVPWTTRETNQTNAGVETALQVNFKQVGLKVKIFPQVVGEEEVVGTVYAETSDLLSIEDFGEGVRAPKTSLSSALVNFTARIGESVVITGLKDSKSEFRNSGVPLLKDLPIVGSAFSYQKRENNDSQVIVVITPLKVGY